MPTVKKTTTKKVVKKEVKETVKKVVVKKAEEKAPVKKLESTLSAVLFDQAGKEKGTATLPEAVFGGKINKALMAQAVRVYLANQRMGSAKTQTRGEVDGSTRKIYRQKGTGRARHGGIRAPIFVGGGIAHGPKVKDYSLDLPTKMKQAAVVSALSVMAKEGKVKVVAGFATIEPKTKHVALAMTGMGLSGKKALLVMPDHAAKVFKAARNIDRMVVNAAKRLNTYEVLNAGTIVVMQEALDVLEKLFKKESK